MTYLNKISSAILITCAAVSLTGCQDDWDAHYGQIADTQYGNASLFEVLSSNAELSDFCAVLKATKCFANSKQTGTTYADLLGSDQFFTVWAPVNGSFNRDSLISLCNSSEGDSLVELRFVKNHVARYSQPYNGENKEVLMLNNKTLSFDGMNFGAVALKSNNLATRNGIIHTLQQPVEYYYNIYEALASKEEYYHLGEFLKSYQVDLLNENKSLAMGIVDGKTVYIDSVFDSKNDLLDYTYGHIDNEDSTYWMIVPTREIWDSIYNEAKGYYNYAYVEKADSVFNRWSHYALMQDLIFNPNVQDAINDSIVSTTYTNSRNGLFHTYYKPFEEGGLFNPNMWSDQLQCSNGMIYEVDQWPYDKYNTYFKRINVEAEGRIAKYDEASKGTDKLTIETYSTLDSRVSNGRYIVVTPAKQTDKYYVEYELPDVLSGTYDVCVVFLPRNIDPSLPFTDENVAGRRNQRPVKFTAEVFYRGTDGLEYSLNQKGRYIVDENDPAYYVKTTDKEVDYLFDCNVNPTKAGRAFMNDPFNIDTVRICTMHFPTCNFDQKEVTNRLRITNAITDDETNDYWTTWFIDRILLLPHKDEVSEE